MTLYFVSDRKGGQGRQDIWMTQKTIDGSKWQKPQNLGYVVNSKYNEETVEISSDGKDLYFSSKGHNSMGGYDVFVTHKNDDGTWTEPENIGYPINTPGDDVFFMLTDNEKFGYYSTTREDSYGDKDIYQVVFLGPEKPTHISFGNPDWMQLASAFGWHGHRQLLRPGQSSLARASRRIAVPGSRHGSRHLR